VGGLGALALLAAGAVLAAARDLPGLGNRYRAPAAPAAREPADPDRAAWDALDAGRDPTTEPPAPSSSAPLSAPTADAGPAPGRSERTDGGGGGDTA
jgi:hypothetical protein